MKALDLIKDSLKRKTLLEDANAYFIMATNYGNKYMAGINSMYKIYTKLNKRYSHLIGKQELKEYAIDDMSDTIWLCWLQGIENAPALVKSCYESIKYHTDKKVVVITKDNFKSYSELPDYIIDKWERGIITNTHFSDILRVNLLIKHGGLWLDSTTYLTGALPSYITDTDFFVYRNGFFDEEMINMGSWLIYSKPNNILLRESEALIFNYWKKNNYLKNYFLLHIFFRMVSDHYSDEWAKVPYVNHIDNHILAMEITEGFNQKRFEQIKNITSIHKLSNKLDLENEKNNSYYSQLENLYKRD